MQFANMLTLMQTKFKRALSYHGESYRGRIDLKPQINVGFMLHQSYLRHRGLVCVHEHVEAVRRGAFPCRCSGIQARPSKPCDFQPGRRRICGDQVFYPRGNLNQVGLLGPIDMPSSNNEEHTGYESREDAQNAEDEDFNLTSDAEAGLLNNLGVRDVQDSENEDPDTSSNTPADVTDDLPRGDVQPAVDEAPEDSESREWILERLSEIQTLICVFYVAILFCCFLLRCLFDIIWNCACSS